MLVGHINWVLGLTGFSYKKRTKLINRVVAWWGSAEV